MPNIEAVIDAILRREGGYVDDPDDLGGVTNHGITIGTLRRLGRDVTGDGQVDRADVRALTRDQAAAILRLQYYEQPKINLLPDIMQPSVLDMYVNAGANAAKLLQQLLLDMGYAVVVDGQIGPITAKAAHSAAQIDGGLFKDAYGIERRNYYLRLADRRPASRKFARTKAGGKGGWIKRAEEFISDTYHLSQSDFQRRTQSWG